MLRNWVIEFSCQLMMSDAMFMTIAAVLGIPENVFTDLKTWRHGAAI